MLRKILACGITMSISHMAFAQDSTKTAALTITRSADVYKYDFERDTSVQKTDTTIVASSTSSSSSPLTTPGMTGPLSINPKPLKFRAGSFGDIYVSGALSGLLQWQNSVSPGDREFQADLSNGQVFVQKVDGLIQFFIQAGWYSLPDLGVPYMHTDAATKNFFGVIPQGFLKIAPSANFSIMAGKLPTLIGAEYTFSYENMNIQRGLLWNQENAVNRGVQVNYKTGRLSLALSWNDGFYSNHYSWGWLSAAYTIDSTSTLTFIGGGNTKHTNISTVATPIYQNNEQIYNLIYSHTSGNWTITPYLQYTYVPQNNLIKTMQNASTYGAALLVNYSIASSSKLSGLSFPFRLEYITSTGSTDKGAPSLIYGPGSNAWSFTVTPTYQYKRFFGRAEYSFVNAGSITSGYALGPTGNSTTQSRLLFEVGVLF